MVRTAAGRLFTRLTPSTERTLIETLRSDRVGGALMLIGTVIAIVWVNSAWSSGYETIRDAVPLGDPSIFGLHLRLDLTLAEWAKDGLLAVFFFVIGLELKRELVVGELRKPATAVVPIVAAIGGMAIPALLYLAVNSSEGGRLDGWAIPTATDIAFALAVVSVVGRRLPHALRAFLLTLAVVDDLLAIIIIAAFYSHGFAPLWLAGAVVAIALFAILARLRILSPWLLVPLALIAWLCVHQSGIHATIAGVALGLVLPARKRADERKSVVERWEHAWSPWSAGVAVPVFAFFAAGVAMNAKALAAVIHDAPSQGVALGLVLGKPVGILIATVLVANFTRARLDRGLSWWDVFGVAVVAGIGFTVSLLIGDLAFGERESDKVKAAVLLASAIAAVAGALILSWRDRHYRRIYENRSTPIAVEAAGAQADQPADN